MMEHLEKCPFSFAKTYTATPEMMNGLKRIAKYHHNLRLGKNFSQRFSSFLTTIESSGDDTVNNRFVHLLHACFKEEFLFSKECLSYLEQRFDYQVCLADQLRLTEMIISEHWGLDYAQRQQRAFFKVVIHVISSAAKVLSLSVDALIETFPEFVQHLKFLSYTIFIGENQRTTDDGFYELLQQRLSQAAETAEALCSYIHDCYGYTLSNEERSDLTLQFHQVLHVR